MESRTTATRMMESRTMNEEQVTAAVSTDRAGIWFRASSFIAFLFFLVIGHSLLADDWPQFRGPRGAGTSRETELPAEWNSTKNIVWKTPLPGYGTSSPITSGDHIYVTCYSGYGLSKESPGDIANLNRHLICLDRGTGRILWDAPSPSSTRVPAYNGFMALHGYASNTPAADKDGVYVFFGSSGAAMFSHDGKPQWEKSLGTRTSGWGSASSPILYKNLVIIHAEVESSTIFALDKVTGREVWSQKYQSGNQHTRATPLLKKSDSGDELVFHSRMGWLSALDPASGRKLWEFEGVSNYQNPSPVTDGSLIFAVAFGKTVAVGSGGREVWKVNKGSEICTPIYHDGHLYWANEGGIAFCVETRTGDLVYEKRLTPSPAMIYASGVLADDRIYYVSRENGTFVVDATPEFRQQAHHRIESDSSVFNATPAISNSQLLLRSDKFLYCIGNK